MTESTYGDRLATPSIRRRLGSMLYESLLLLGVLAAGFMLPHLILGIAWGVSATGPLLVVHVYAVLAVYFLWLWRKDGQTLAMQTWRIKLVDAGTGSVVTLARGLARYTLAWPSLLIYGVGLIWALFDRDRQFLHDRLCGTRLVQLPPARGN